MATHSYHEPVLLAQTLGQLDLMAGHVIVDGTVGGGGHAEAILDRTSPDGLLIGLDLDSDAIREAAARLEPYGDRVRLVEASFRRQSLVHSFLGGNGERELSMREVGVFPGHNGSPARLLGGTGRRHVPRNAPTSYFEPRS